MSESIRQSDQVQPGSSPHDAATKARLRIELGRAYIPADRVADMAAGSVIELDSTSDADVEVYSLRCRSDGSSVSGGAWEFFARGELLAVDGKLGVRVRKTGETNAQP